MLSLVRNAHAPPKMLGQMFAGALVAPANRESSQFKEVQRELERLATPPATTGRRGTLAESAIEAQSASSGSSNPTRPTIMPAAFGLTPSPPAAPGPGALPIGIRIKRPPSPFSLQVMSNTRARRLETYKAITESEHQPRSCGEQNEWNPDPWLISEQEEN